MKKEFITLYDFSGKGGFWLIVSAQSKEQIENTYPMLHVLEPPPLNEGSKEYRAIREKLFLDIDDTEGELAKMLQNERKSDYRNSAGNRF